MKILLIASIIFLSCIQDSYSNEDIYFVVRPKINLYSKPSRASEIITQLEYAQIIDSYETIDVSYVPFDERKTTWRKIKIKDMEGYVPYEDIGYVTNIERIPPLFLTLKLLNGDTIKFQNKPSWDEGFTVYELLFYNKDIGFYVIRQYLIEGYFTFLVSDIDGEKYKILGDPIISPDKKQILVLSLDLYAQYNDSGVEIYSIVNNIPIIKYKRMGNVDSLIWGAKNGKWISNSEVEYTKEEFPIDIDTKGAESQVNLKKVSDIWVEKPPNIGLNEDTR